MILDQPLLSKGLCVDQCVGYRFRFAENNELLAH